MTKFTIHRILRKIWKPIDWLLAILMLLLFSLGFFVSMAAIVIAAPICLIEMIRALLPDWTIYPLIPVYVFWILWAGSKWVIPFSLLPIKVIGRKTT